MTLNRPRHVTWKTSPKECLCALEKEEDPRCKHRQTIRALRSTHNGMERLAWCLVLVVVACCDGTTLMKRIRERHNADDTVAGVEAWAAPTHDVLVSIDGKLKGLDTFMLRLDFTLDQLARRMDGLETKLTRLDAKFDMRIASKDVRGEMANEQMARRVGSLTERATALEVRMESRMGKAMSKLDSLERDLHSSVDEILERLVKGEEKTLALESEVVKAGEKVEVLARSVEAGQKRGEETLKTLRDSIDNLSPGCQREEDERGRSGDADRVVTREQMDNLTAVLGRALTTHEARFRELDSDVEKYTQKVVNGIQQLWRTSDELKSDLSSTLVQGNKTREMVRQEFQRLHEQIEPLPKLEPKLSGISEDLERKVFELSATVDASFATLLVAQNTFIDSCQRIQQEETHVYDLLQKVVYEMRNRSASDVARISGQVAARAEDINMSLAGVLAAVLATGNATATALRDLLEQPSKCVVVKAEDWSLVESRKSSTGEDRNVSDTTQSDPDRELPIDAVYDAEMDLRDQGTLNLQDYDADYPLSESY